MAFPHLLSGLRIRESEFRNRMIVPAMATHFAEPDGCAGRSVIDYLAARAAGGFGAVVTENIGVDPAGRVMARMLMADHDRFVPGLTRLADGIRSQGAIALGQINHGGRQTTSKITGQQPVAPSPIPCPLMREMPRALTVDEIYRIQDSYAAGAARLERAGFDGVEIHAAHGYLAAEFLSRYSNRREDDFGGDLTNRLRFLTGIIDRIRASTSARFLLFVRMSVEEFVPDGIDTEETIRIGNRLAPMGVDALSLSVGVYESYNRLTMLSGEPEGPWLPMAKRVRDATSLPVVGVGRIRRAEMAEDAIRNAEVDLVALGRASITDPDFPNRLKVSAARPVSGCTYCNLCLGRSAKPQMICPINPFVGREATLPRQSARRSRQIAIRGGGIAAMTAGWLAARRGFDLTIIEARGDFGGMQGWRSRVPGQEEYRDAVRAVMDRAIAAGVTFAQDAASISADASVWTVRRYEPVRVPKPGDVPSLTSFDVLRDPDIRLGPRIVVTGDDLSSADAAVLLAAKGHQVLLRTPAKDIGFDAHPGFRSLNKSLLSKYGAAVAINVPVEELHATDGFDAIVCGRAPEAPSQAEPRWMTPYGDGGALIIDDAYEPGALASAVYKAVDEAMSFCDP